MFVIKSVVLKPEHVFGAKKTVYSHSCLSIPWKSRAVRQRLSERCPIFLFFLVNSKLMNDTVLKALGNKILLERKINLMPMQRPSEQQAGVRSPGLALSQAISLIFVHLCSIS